jgi:hypothetical protein
MVEQKNLGHLGRVDPAGSKWVKGLIRPLLTFNLFAKKIFGLRMCLSNTPLRLF